MSDLHTNGQHNPTKLKNSGLRLLLVDADELVLDSLSLLLRTAGNQVETASSLSEAVAKAKLSRPDALLTDCNLNDEQGIAVISAIRAAIHVNLPAVVFTDTASTVAPDHQLPVNCLEMAKPYCASEMWRLLRMLPSTKQSGESNRHAVISP